MVLNAETELGD